MRRPTGWRRAKHQVLGAFYSTEMTGFSTSPRTPYAKLKQHAGRWVCHHPQHANTPSHFLHEHKWKPAGTILHFKHNDENRHWLWLSLDAWGEERAPQWPYSWPPPIVVEGCLFSLKCCLTLLKSASLSLSLSILHCWLFYKDKAEWFSASGPQRISCLHTDKLKDFFEQTETSDWYSDEKPSSLRIHLQFSDIYITGTC